MSVNKVNGFAAPYRSATFRAETDAIVKRNGVLSLESDVYESGGDVIVPPFSVVQQGLVITKTNQTNIIKPLTLEPPYYVTVSAPTPVNTDDLVFQFARTPLDVAPNEVILAEYDGVEWRQQPFVSIDGLIKDRASEIVERGETGPYSGLITTTSGPNYKNSAGLLFDKLGDKIRFDEDFLTPQVASDPEPTWRRVDRMIYRRPIDDVNRIGVRKLVIGGSFAPSGPKKLYNTIINTGSSNTTSAKSVIGSDNASYTFFAEGYGASFDIVLRKYSSNRQTLLGALTVVSAASSSQFSVAIDSSDHIHLVYESAGNIQLVIMNSVGAILYGPINVDGLTNPCSNPQISIDPLNTKSYIAFEYLQGPSNKQIYLATRSLAGALITPSVRITNTASNITNPSIDVSSDLLVHMAYEELSGVKYIVLDDIGQVIEPEILISGATGSTSYGTLTTNASAPIVKVTDNKVAYVCFKQKKTVSLTGVAIYANGSAFMPNFISVPENFTNFSFHADSFDNCLHFCMSQAGSIDYVLVKDNVPVMVENIQLTGASSVHVVKDKFGSLLHAFSLPESGTYTNAGTPQAVEHIGAVAVAGSMNPLVLNNNQLSFASSISPTPMVGMRVSLAGSVAGNNLVKIITAVELQDIDAVGDTYVVTVDSAFTATESPALAVTCQFSVLNGNLTRIIKTVADSTEVRALRTTEIDSDILLARISWPGPIILNYIPSSGAGVDSDLFGMYGDIDVDWGATSANTLTMTSGLRIIDLLTSSVYTVNGGSFPMAEGDALYVTLDGSAFTISPAVAPITALPWATPIQVLGFRKNGEFNPHLFSVAGMGQLDVGEQIVLGQDLSKTLRIRLGITGEAGYAPYTSTVVIAPSDPYSTAISKLDGVIASLAAETAEEEDFIVTNPLGQTTFTKSVMSDWSANNTAFDITVYVNGIKQKQDVTGGLTQDYRKTAVDTIEFSYTVPKDARVTIRDERTGVPPMGGGVDLTNITVDPQPITNAAFALGSVSKAWRSLYLKDTLSAQVYELKVIGGVLQAVEVP